MTVTVFHGTSAALGNRIAETLTTPERLVWDAPPCCRLAWVESFEDACAMARDTVTWLKEHGSAVDDDRGIVFEARVLPDRLLNEPETLTDEDAIFDWYYIEPEGKLSGAH